MEMCDPHAQRAVFLLPLFECFSPSRHGARNVFFFYRPSEGGEKKKMRMGGCCVAPDSRATIFRQAHSAFDIDITQFNNKKKLFPQFHFPPENGVETPVGITHDPGKLKRLYLILICFSSSTRCTKRKLNKQTQFELLIESLHHIPINKFIHLMALFVSNANGKHLMMAEIKFPSFSTDSTSQKYAACRSVGVNNDGMMMFSHP